MAKKKVTITAGVIASAVAAGGLYLANAPDADISKDTPIDQIEVNAETCYLKDDRKNYCYKNKKEVEDGILKLEKEIVTDADSADTFVLLCQNEKNDECKNKVKELKGKIDKGAAHWDEIRTYSKLQEPIVIDNFDGDFHQIIKNYF